MKKILIVGLLLFASRVHSQNLSLSVQESKVYKMTTARVQNDYILPDTKGGFITISTKRSGFLANPLVYESYATYYNNNNLEQIRQKTFKLNKGSIKGSIKGAFIFDDKLNLINLETNFRKKYISFKRILAHLDNAGVQQEEFFRIEGIYSKNEVNLFVNLNSLYYEKLKYYSDVNFFNPKIFIKFSKNNQFFAIVHRDFEAAPTRYIVNVFNKDFQQVFTRTITNKNPADLFYINDIVVDDATGDTYVAAKIYNTNPLKKKRLLNTDNLKTFVLYKVAASEVQSFDLKPEKVIEQLQLLLDKELVIYGFYRNRYIDLNDIDGIFRMNVEPEHFHKQSGMYDKFSKKLVSTSYKRVHKKTKNHKMIVRKSYLLADGSLLINSEDFYIPLMMKKKDRETEIREIVGDVFSIKVSEQGKVLWSKRIYKQQVVKPRLALHSFFSSLYNGYNYILFTDTRLKKPEKSEPFYLNDKDLQNLYGIKINQYGNLQKGLVKENKRSKFRFMPIEGTMITKNEAIIPAKDHQYIKFYKIKLN